MNKYIFIFCVMVSLCLGTHLHAAETSVTRRDLKERKHSPLNSEDDASSSISTKDEEKARIIESAGTFIGSCFSKIQVREPIQYAEMSEVFTLWSSKEPIEALCLKLAYLEKAGATRGAQQPVFLDDLLALDPSLEKEAILKEARHCLKIDFDDF